MRIRKRKFKKKLKDHKLIVLCTIFFVLLVVFVTIPTLSSYKNRNLSQGITVWDGTIANSYRSGKGTLEEPYIIADAAELAYFASQLKITDYEGKYFELSNNIVLNDGKFSYNKNDGIKYIKDNIENEIIPHLENTLINEFQHLNGFKGTLDGNYYSIYGLYIDNSLDEQNALFTNLEGNIKNIYIENSVIYSGKITAGVASKAKDSTITNVLYDGFVISDEEISNEIVTIELGDIINDQALELSYNLDINNLNCIPGLITEVILSGTYNSNNNDGILKINNEIINNSNFEITLGDKIVTSIPISYESNIENNISLTDLKYQIKYEYSNAAGIISIAENTNLENIINKAKINGSVYSAGIINFLNGETTLENVYNIGEVDGNNIDSGLISSINQNKQDTTIINVYNNGKIVYDNGSMIGNIENNTGNVRLENVFNPQDNYVINKVEATNVTINNSYVITDKHIQTGTSNGDFIPTTKENLENKEFIISKLKYEEYEEEKIDENFVWIFEDGALPKLFFDYQIANIRISEYKWDKYTKDLNTLNFSKNFVFSIEASHELNGIKEIYYYLSDTNECLSKEQLNEITNWTKYENITEINKEGIYTIYAKIINYNDSITYLNTDKLMLDFTGANVTISALEINKTWENLNQNLNNNYIDKEITINITAEDNLSGIKEIYYYKTNTALSIEELESLEDWNQYIEDIPVTSKQTIIYAKVIDNCGNITYVNTDLIIINGYTLNSISPGMNGESISNLYITEKSSVSLNFSYQDTNEYIEGSKHQLISNTLFPENTIITIIDKINNKVYKYITTNSDYGYNDCLNNICEATYNFELFNEVGSTNKFQESNYTGIINEEFIVNIDFKNTEINGNIENISAYLKLYNTNEFETKNTIKSTLKKFNINTEDSKPEFTLSSGFKDIIKYSENAKYIIDFSTKINYKYFEEYKIFDTTFEDKNIGIAIKMTTPDGSIIDKKHLKNMTFSIGDKKYSPSSDGIVRINLKKGITDITDNLTVQTFMDNSTLSPGDYKLIITLYTAYDSLYSNINLNSIEIPIYVGRNTYKNESNFNVIMNDEDKIITTATNEFNFNFLVSNILENANVKISLYKKSVLSAYDQKYTMVDLGEYFIDKTYERYEENIYFAAKNIKNNDTLSINLNTNLLEKNGYMFVFELFEDEKLVSKINKKFIVK